MVNSYKAASDIEVLTSNFPIPGYGLVPINAFVIKGSEPVLVDTGTVVESAELHGRPAVGHRSRRPPVDLAHPHRLRPHRQPARVAGREPADPGDHDVPRRGHHEPVRPAADGQGLSRQPRPEDHRGRPHAHRRQASRVRQPVHDRLLRREVGGRSSAPTASERSFRRRRRRTRPTSRTRISRKGRSSGRRSTRRGCTRWTGPRSRRSSTASAGWSRRWS